MKNLIISDFYRILKTKVTYVSLILAFVMPLLMAGLYAGLEAALNGAIEESGESLLNFTGEALMASTFSLTNNFGLVVPVFVVIVIMADISSGTIRNKIIFGYKRHQIFASHFITAFTYCLITMIVYAGMTALWSIVLLGGFEMDSAKQLSYLYFYILGFIGFSVVVAIASCLCLSSLNSPLSIIVTLAICIIASFVISLLSGFEFNEVTEHILRFLPSFVLSKVLYDNITTIMFLESLGGIVIFTCLAYGLGTYIFSKRDLK